MAIKEMRQRFEKVRQANLNGSWNGVRQCQGIASLDFKAVVKNRKLAVNVGGDLNEKLPGVISPEGKANITDNYEDNGKTEIMSFTGNLSSAEGDRKSILDLAGNFEGCQIVLTNRKN